MPTHSGKGDLLRAALERCNTCGPEMHLDQGFVCKYYGRQPSAFTWRDELELSLGDMTCERCRSAIRGHHNTPRVAGEQTGHQGVSCWLGLTTPQPDSPPCDTWPGYSPVE
jgi:hypothetical protein